MGGILFFWVVDVELFWRLVLVIWFVGIMLGGYIVWVGGDVCCV